MRAAKLVPAAGAVAALVLSAACGSASPAAGPAPTTPASSSLSVATPLPLPSSSEPTASTPSTAPSTSARRSTSRSSVPAPVTTRARATSAAPRTSAVPTPASTHASSAAPAFPAGHGPVVVLDPGHNGGNAAHAAEIGKQVPAGYGRTKSCNTTGTSTNAGYAEHAFTWDVALRTRRLLQAAGARVILTRDSDTGVGPCVDERARIQSQAGVAAAVAIHADGAAAGDRGFVVFTAAQRPEGATAATVDRSHRLAAAVHGALVSQSGVQPANYYDSDGYASSSEYAGLNLSSSPTAFLELGNMRDPDDAAYESSASGRQHIADAIAAGILAYLR